MKLGGQQRGPREQSPVVTHWSAGAGETGIPVAQAANL